MHFFADGGHFISILSSTVRFFTWPVCDIDKSSSQFNDF